MSETSHGDDALAATVRALADRLLARGWTVATAESCTGGWIAKVLTDVAGSSAWFASGVVTYSNAAKQALLGVDDEVLRRHGAVSRECALAMADGARRRFDVDLAVAVTGIAGPGGGSAQKPVGTVWIAWAGESLPACAQGFVFEGNRERIRRQSVAAALQGVLVRATLAGGQEGN